MSQSLHKKALLIDGNHLFYRSFFAIKHLSTVDGIPTNALYGFLKTLLNLLQEVEPTSLAICFDTKGKTYRSKILPEYKANRPPPPSSLIQQSKMIRDILTEIGISWFELVGYEADDLLATLATEFEKEGQEAYVYSGDKDLLQLVSSKIHVLVPVQKQIKPQDATAEFIYEKYGVYPTQIVDFKSLVGDPSDNIKGVPKIGPKTAAKLLQKYSTIDNLLEVFSKETEKVIDCKGILKRNKELIQLQRSAPLEVQTEKLLFNDLDREKWMNIANRFSFRSIAKDIQGKYSNLFGEGIGELFPKDSLKEIVLTAENASEIIFQLQEEEQISIAIQSEKLLVATHVAIYILSLEDIRSNHAVRESMFQLCSSTTSKKWFFDAKQIAHVLRLSDNEWFQNYDDVQLLFFVRKPNAKQYSLEDYCSEVNTTLDQPVSSILSSVNGLWNQVEESNQLSLYLHTEKPLLQVLYRMEKKGITVSREYLKIVQAELEEKIEKITKEIHNEAGQEFNIASPKQLSFILFEKMGLPAKKKTKTGYSTNADVLEELKSFSPVIEKIQLFREYTKMLQTYVVGLDKAANNSHSCIHTTFLQAGPATGRISSIHPNLQNLPSDSTWGPYIKKAFIAAEDNIYISADYSQIDLRVLAHFSQDNRMQEAFHANRDIHEWTARQIFRIPEEKTVHSDFRKIAKTVNFGVIYGMTPHGLSQSLHIPIKEAKQFIDMYFRTFPGVHAFTEKAVQEATITGYATTLLGRRRPIPELQSRNKIVQALGQRLAVNTIIQGTSADIIKKAMIDIDASLASLYQSKMIVQIHDEIIVEGPVKEQPVIVPMIEQKMTNALTLSVPLHVQFHVGKTLADLKE